MTDNVKEIELDIEDARQTIAFHDAYVRLTKNADFQLLIEKNYFIDEAARLVEFKANPAVQNDAAQAAIIKALDAIGGLQQYFNKLGFQADNAERALEEANEALAEIAAEGEA